MSNDDPRDKGAPKGAEALDEISRRLGGVFGDLRDAFETVAAKVAEAAKDRDASGARVGGRLDDAVDETRDVLIEGSNGPIDAKVGWRVRTLEGLSGDDGPRFAPRSAPSKSSATSRRPAAAGGRANKSPNADKTGPTQTEQAQAEAQPAPRTALVDVFDEADCVVVTAELPGVAADDIALELDGAVLKIRAGGVRRFEADAALPTDVVADQTPDLRLSNGVLEVRLAKAAADRPTND